ncbi:hypothetical protein [Rhizobium sp. BK176]|uniref:hypothetical protein n=1 Tax=Rhizobium sp. BK176 TaxID=2587071 RepID=UPI0021684495|nr:hypothetical protein [Rhizobium sp. BK176]MCS4089645.1 hypothetical protein [Rhizobium sp. BK176]
MTEADAILTAIFDDDHKPARKIGRGMYHPGRAVVFPTKKVPTGSIRARSPLMADGLIHLDTDPKVVRLSPYPLETAYWSTLDEETPAKRDHIPDIAIMLRDDRIVFIDYVPLAEQAATPHFARRVAERTRHFRNEFGCAYAVHDERSVRIQPLLSNLRLMWAHRQLGFETAAQANARHFVRLASLPATIRTISENAGRTHQAIKWEGDEHPTPLPETDLVFTAVMQLAMRGEVRLDLGKPLTFDSTVQETAQ